MSKSRTSLLLALALTGCPSPPVGEMNSNDRVDMAADEVGRQIATADSTARTHQFPCRLVIAPGTRTMWISRRADDGSYEPMDGSRRMIHDDVTIDRVEGMTPGSDASWWVDFPATGGVSRPLIVHLSDREGARRRVELMPGEFRPRAVNPEEE